MIPSLMKSTFLAWNTIQTELNRFRVLLFDFDGTIILSEGIAEQSTRAVFKMWGLDLQEQDAFAIVGKRWDAAVSLLATRYTLPCSESEALRILTEHYFKSLSEQEVQLVPGVQTFLTKIREAQIPFAIVSGSSRIEIEHVLQRLGWEAWPQFIIGAEDYTHSKPDPESFQRALKRFHVQPQEALVFEDSEPGIRAARSAQIPVLALTETSIVPQAWHEANAGFPHFEALLEDEELARRVFASV